MFASGYERSQERHWSEFAPPRHEQLKRKHHLCFLTTTCCTCVSQKIILYSKVYRLRPQRVPQSPH